MSRSESDSSIVQAECFHVSRTSLRVQQYNPSVGALRQASSESLRVVSNLDHQGGPAVLQLQCQHHCISAVGAKYKFLDIRLAL